jgi:hypothetical protein
VLDHAAQADGFLGVPAEELRGVRDLAPCVRKRLPVLEDDEPGQGLCSLGHEVECAAQDLAARPGADLGPGVLRLVCDLHGSQCLGHGAVGDLGDDLLGGGVHDRDRPVSIERLAAHDRAEWDRPEGMLDFVEAVHDGPSWWGMRVS